MFKTDFMKRLGVFALTASTFFFIGTYVGGGFVFWWNYTKSPIPLMTQADVAMILNEQNP